MNKLLAPWNRFFFEPISGASLALFRIAFGLVVIESLIGKIQDRTLFWGQSAIISKATAENYFPGLNLKLSLLYLVPGSDSGLLFFFLFLILVASFVTIGLFTRASSVVLFLGLLALSNRDFLVENSGDDLIRINCFYLMFAHAGAWYSLDHWFFNRKSPKATPEKISPWPLRMIQLQLAYVYIDSVFLKMQGHAWREGEAMYYALNYLEFKRFDLHFLFSYLWQVKLATWSVLAIEFAAGSLIWFRKTRYWVLGAAVILHLGINLIMQLPIFQWVMIASLLSFVIPEDIEKLLVTKPWLRFSR